MLLGEELPKRLFVAQREANLHREAEAGIGIAELREAVRFDWMIAGEDRAVIGTADGAEK